jgi:hypothetical protein
MKLKRSFDIQIINCEISTMPWCGKQQGMKNSFSF